ncbi:hypothetical protein SAMN04487972_12349 [Paracoccus halophilus]|uniref:Uncharacterized protein n=1 Tax=Paracoccus halophilus TaxID=376733 RepID=A0A1I0U5I2_9RHOB|nr:hypothetical protein [Paracoccus halophilus]SFA59264.1 hypothetical protein SAMN04487972_12349 [Paracoccus halophilus]
MAKATQQCRESTGAKAPGKPVATAAPERPCCIPSISKGQTLPCKPATKLDRLRSALNFMAELVLRDPSYVPIFTRLEEEIAIEEAKCQDDALARARALIHQNAMRQMAAA